MCEILSRVTLVTSLTKVYINKSKSSSIMSDQEDTFVLSVPLELSTYTHTSTRRHAWIDHYDPRLESHVIQAYPRRQIVRAQ
jgi:hypothetical protein